VIAFNCDFNPPVSHCTKTVWWSWTPLGARLCAEQGLDPSILFRLVGVAYLWGGSQLHSEAYRTACQVVSSSSWNWRTV